MFFFALITIIKIIILKLTVVLFCCCLGHFPHYIKDGIVTHWEFSTYFQNLKSKKPCGTRQLHCHVCGRRFKHVMSLKQHLQMAHKNHMDKSKQFVCLCDQEFPTLEKLNSHKILCLINNSKSTRTKFRCHICDQIFQRRWMLRDHVAILHSSWRINLGERSLPGT